MHKQPTMSRPTEAVCYVQRVPGGTASGVAPSQNPPLVLTFSCAAK